MLGFLHVHYLRMLFWSAAGLAGALKSSLSWFFTHSLQVGGLGLTLISTGTLSVSWAGPNMDSSKPLLLATSTSYMENIPKHTSRADSISVLLIYCTMKILKIQSVVASWSRSDSDPVYKKKCLFILTPFWEQTFLRLRQNKQLSLTVNSHTQTGRLFVPGLKW